MTRPASPGEFLHPLHPRRKSSRVSCGSQTPLPLRPLTKRLKAPLGAILHPDGNFPILPSPVAPRPLHGPPDGIRALSPSGCATRVARARPSRLPSPPMPAVAREEGPTEDGGGIYANPAHARHASREGGAFGVPLPPLPMPRKPRAHAPAHYAPSRTRGARSKCFAYTRERKRRDT